MKITKATYASIDRLAKDGRLGIRGEILGIKCIDDVPCFEVLYPDKSIEFRPMDTSHVIVSGNKGFSY